MLQLIEQFSLLQLKKEHVLCKTVMRKLVTQDKLISWHSKETASTISNYLHMHGILG